MNSISSPHRPVALDLDRSRSLRVQWSDGLDAEIALPRLRQACPCATCRDAREESRRNPLRVISGAASEQDRTTASGAELVGRYAVRIRWNDGHDTGIYDFSLLRQLTEACSDSQNPLR